MIHITRNTDPIKSLHDAIEGYRNRTCRVPHDLKCALIDMDGTLYDSMPWHAKAWHRMVTELGIEACEDEFFAYEGMTGKATINLLFKRAMGREATDEEVTELYGRKTLYFKENNRAVIMPGAQAMVAEFRNAGITPVLVTGSGQATLINRLSDDFDGAFPEELRITSRDVTKGKPAPEPYLKGLTLIKAEPWQAIVMENAPLGVRSGVDAGIFTIAVNTGRLPADMFEDAGADLLFDSMTECAEILPELLYIINARDKGPSN